jgi:type VI secretion system protein ImpG
VGGVQCRFRTAYPVRLFPIRVASASFSHAANVPGGVSGTNARYAVRIDLQARGTAKFSTLQMRDLRFHIGGDLQAAHWLYELLLTNVSQVLLRCQEKGGKWISVALGDKAIREVGFNRDEAILPYAETSFQGYRLLQEYFSFPQKFLFFDLTELETVTGGPFSDRLEIVILLEEF